MMPSYDVANYDVVFLGENIHGVEDAGFPSTLWKKWRFPAESCVIFRLSGLGLLIVVKKIG